MVADSASVKALIAQIWVLCELKGIRDRLSDPAPATPCDSPEHQTESHTWVSQRSDGADAAWLVTTCYGLPGR